MPADSAHTSNWQIAEVVFGFPFLAGIALHFLHPLRILPGPARWILLAAGILLILGGLALMVTTRREFNRYQQPTDPGQPTGQLIRTGPFAWSRNPLYLAAVLLFLGLDLALNNLWALFMLPVSIILCHFILIVPEESYLAAHFGNEFTAYTAAVHRWLGRK
jgi:protein-S-isoprenylcysteine O-methyltransferase Ste14